MGKLFKVQKQNFRFYESRNPTKKVSMIQTMPTIIAGACDHMVQTHSLQSSKTVETNKRSSRGWLVGGWNDGTLSDDESSPLIGTTHQQGNPVTHTHTHQTSAFKNTSTNKSSLNLSPIRPEDHDHHHLNHNPKKINPSTTKKKKKIFHLEP